MQKIGRLSYFLFCSWSSSSVFSNTSGSILTKSRDFWHFEHSGTSYASAACEQNGFIFSSSFSISRTDIFAFSLLVLRVWTYSLLFCSSDPAFWKQSLRRHAFSLISKLSFYAVSHSRAAPSSKRTQMLKSSMS